MLPTQEETFLVLIDFDLNSNESRWDIGMSTGSESSGLSSNPREGKNNYNLSLLFQIKSCIVVLVQIRKTLCVYSKKAIMEASYRLRVASATSLFLKPEIVAIYYFFLLGCKNFFCRWNTGLETGMVTHSPTPPPLKIIWKFGNSH